MGLTVSTKKNEVFEYVPSDFRGQENPFTLKIKRIDPKTFAQLEDGLTKINQEDSTIIFASGSFNWNVARRGIVGWENISDENNKPIKFGTDSANLISEQTLSLIPMEIIAEVATTIASITRSPENTELFLGNPFKSDAVETESTK